MRSQSVSKSISQGLEQLKTATNYQFSATKLNDLGANEYTIATVVLDVSGSVAAYSKELEACLKSVLKACKKSPRADNLMFRFTTFNDAVREIHGFKQLNPRDSVAGCEEVDYDNSVNCSGSTALYDAVHEAVECSKTYGANLMGNEFLTNAIIFIVTDGDDNASSTTRAAIKKAVESVRKSESLESINIVLIGVTQGDVMLNSYLKDFVNEAGLTQYVDLGTATPQKIAKLAQFVSQSISSTSSALNSGQKSKPVSFTF
jgi:hypothetical protein